MNVDANTGQKKIPVSPFQLHALATMLAVRLECITGLAATTAMIQTKLVINKHGMGEVLVPTVKPVDRILEEGQRSITLTVETAAVNRHVQSTAVAVIFLACAGHGWTALKAVALLAVLGSLPRT